jgi:hypothetical protein
MEPQGRVIHPWNKARVLFFCRPHSLRGDRFDSRAASYV